ncbi:lysophosphatidylcholine acyltransferase 2-like [Hydra vulgaris]|uniref:Lysophosphatidylcholine acyltransferase 2-like n=1 Tax=Hydra vulgaris TaxID=6087 RepID=A0ABM4DPU7_HYDVU
MKDKSLKLDHAFTLYELDEKLLQLVPGLKKAREKPPVHNPFISELKLSTFDKIKMAFLIILVPIRLLLLGFTLLAAGVVAKVSLIGFKESNPPVPMHKFRRFGQFIVWIFARMASICCGFHYVPVKGKLAAAKDAPIVVVAPHTSFVDSLSFLPFGYLSAVSASENLKVPVMGNYIRLLQPIVVSRADRDSKVFVANEIKRRSAAGVWPPIVIFPEGTTTNHQCFITFKPGAFYPGLPVQPVLLRYPDRMDYASWTWIGPGALYLLVVMMSRLHNRQSVEVLPVYTPNEKEKKDPFLYARNVREYMAKLAEIPVSDHSYEDCRLMMEAQKLGLPMEAGIVEYYKLSNLLNINCEHMIEYLHKFAIIDKNHDGYIDFTEFSNYLHLPHNDEVKAMFHILCIDKNHVISFREYLVGTFLILKPLNTEEKIKRAFLMLDEDDDGFLTYASLSTFLRNSMQLGDSFIGKIFKDMNPSNADHIDFNNFAEFCSAKPEYGILFMHFQKLKEDSLLTDNKAENTQDRKSMSPKSAYKTRK